MKHSHTPLGLSSFVAVNPTRVLTNADYENRFQEHGIYNPEKNLNEKFIPGGFDILSRTGIEERAFFPVDTKPADHVIAGLKELAHQTHTKMKDMTVLLGSSRPDVEQIADQVSESLHVPATGINAACSSFSALMRKALDEYDKKPIAVATLESWGDFINTLDKNLVVFGDGLHLTLVSEAKERFADLLDAEWQVHELSDLDPVSNSDVVSFSVQDGMNVEGHWEQKECFMMNGRLIFKIAPNAMVQALVRGLARSDQTIQDIDRFVCHGANTRMIPLMVKGLNEIAPHKGNREWLPADVCMNIVKTGNRGCDSVPSYIYNHPEMFQSGDTIGISVAGAGPHLAPRQMTTGFVKLRKT